MNDGHYEDVPSLIAPLMEPLTIRGLTIPNRVVMSPMTRCFCPDGVPGEEVASYYRRRAEGEAGLIVTEAIAPDHTASIGDTGLGEKDLPRLAGPDTVAGWRRVAEEVHAAGGKIIPQLWHQGPLKMPGTGPFPDVPAFAPSGYYGDPKTASSIYVDKMDDLAVPLPVPTDAEIVEVVESFRRAAAGAREAGFDGVAIHGAHGYLIDTFLWATTNFRTDRWGGDAVCRTRFAVEVIKAIRQEIGEDKPIIFRFSQWKQQDFKAKLAETPDELEAILGPLADAGVDLFDASVRYFNTPAFPGSEMGLAGWAKKLTGKLSGTVGGIGFNKGMWDSIENKPIAVSNNLPLVMERFNRGEFDIVSIGRAILSDANWIKKARLGEELPVFDPGTLTRLA